MCLPFVQRAKLAVRPASCPRAKLAGSRLQLLVELTDQRVDLLISTRLVFTQLPDSECRPRRLDV